MERRLQKNHAETETGAQNEPIARLGDGTISEIIYSPNGELIAAAGAIGIWLYDAESLAEVGSVAQGATTIAFSLDGQIFASGLRTERTVHLWDVGTQKQVGRLRLSDGRGVSALTFAHDGKTMVVGYEGGDIGLWILVRKNRFHG